MIEYITYKESELYEGNTNCKYFIRNILSEIDKLYEIIPINWINIRNLVYVYLDYYVEIPEELYRHSEIYLTQDKEYGLEVDINPMYKLNTKIIDL